MNATRLYAIALHPWTVLGSLVSGALFGALVPAAAVRLAVLGDIYVGLLKMTALPFMISAVIFSLQRLLRIGGTGRLLARVAAVFVATSLLVAVVATAVLLVARPGAGLSHATMATFGRIVGADLGSTDTIMALYGVDAIVAAPGFLDLLLGMVPTNIFAALASGEVLKALVFALLFGMAVGHVPSRISDGLTQALETVYHACQKLMHWLSYPLPLVLFCMSASQLAKIGWGPLQAMVQFVLAFGIAALLLLLMSLSVIWRRSGRNLGTTCNALRAPFALAIATRNSAACMPTMIESLVDGLGFARSRVELLVPLAISLLRIGPVAYYACATLFIAQLYGRPLGPLELLTVVLASVLAGFASAGMTGLVTVSLVGMTCAYLHLPFEAAFVLFLAVDPICDILRTVVLVIGNAAAIAVICPRPLDV